MTSETGESESSGDERAERNEPAEGDVEDERYADGEDQDAVRDDKYADDGEGVVRDGRYADVDTSHLDDVADGCGCAEVWEHTSSRRAAEGDAGAD